MIDSSVDTYANSLNFILFTICKQNLYNLDFIVNQIKLIFCSRCFPILQNTNLDNQLKLTIASIPCSIMYKESDF